MVHAREDYKHIQDPRCRIPMEEPVFLLRAQDGIAPAVLMYWAELAKAFNVNQEMINLVIEHAIKMDGWQHAHGKKVPDMPPVMAPYQSLGALLISAERYEQVYKHGFSAERDTHFYGSGELLQAARFCLDDGTPFPANWDIGYGFKIASKKPIDKLVIMGAFIAAEIDRRINNGEQPYCHWSSDAKMPNSDKVEEPVAHAPKERETLVWADIKALANSLTDEQLEQPVKWWSDDEGGNIDDANILDEDHVNNGENYVPRSALDPEFVVEPDAKVYPAGTVMLWRL